MSSVKPPALPAILIANDLLSGDVVFLAESGWSRDPAAALVAEDEASARQLEAAGHDAMRRNAVVDAYLVDVDLSADGIPVPRHFRERFRLLGPTIRPDLGKQAEFPGLAAQSGRTR
ncbi:MAG: DUF2849 domain-containing protein [Beijerinckiaceae bacterium]|jgi:hypothetical protein|nr:DUF2849 domain-containing protein [Beijerinckiaceae bacterium]